MPGKQLQTGNGRVADARQHCENCGRAVDAGWHYCAWCGAEL